MKSLIEEASTIGKAIEKAWERAGRPQSFSVKVFENPEYGFLGITKKYGKIALLFEDPLIVDHTKKKSANLPANNKKSKGPKRLEPKDENISSLTDGKLTKEPSQNIIKHENTPLQAATIKTQREKSYIFLSTDATDDSKEGPSKKQSHKYIWTEKMVEHADSIIKQMIYLLDRPDVHFNIKNEDHNLKIIFSGLLVHEPTKEYAFYKHFAHLIITALRAKFKTEFKHLRLVLSRE